MCVPSKRGERRLGKFVSRRQFKNLGTFEKCDCENEFGDALSKSTQFTKAVFEFLNDIFAGFQKSPTYKILFQTTQPAHLITIVAVAALALLLFSNKNQDESSMLLNFMYLGAFSTYLGAQIWMTFVSGLSLYFSLPRHHFGNVQRVLFPKYFTLNSFLSFITLAIYTKRHNSELDAQMAILATAFLLNLLIRLYLAPPLVRLMLVKNRIEVAAGVGMEIGGNELGPLSNCPHYIRVHKSFRKVHMSIAIGNIATMACTISHLSYLSAKLCVL